MELHSYSIDVFSLFKEKIQDAIGLVTQIPVEQKDEAWKFWELMSETVKLLTRIYIDGQQTVNIEVCVNTEDNDNKEQNTEQDKQKTKRKRGRPKRSNAETEDNTDGKSPAKARRKQTGKSPAKTKRNSKKANKKSEKEKEESTETVTEMGQGDDLNDVASPSGSSDHGTVDDVVSSFNLDFSDLMSIPSSVEAPQSQMSNTNLQSPLHIDNVMTPVSNKEDLAKDNNENSVNTCIYREASNKVETVKNLTDKENIVPMTDDSIQPVIEFEMLEEPDESSPVDKVRRSRRRKKKNVKDKEIYKFENKRNSEDHADDNQIDLDMDVNDEDDADTDELGRPKGRRKKRNRVKPQGDDSENTDITCEICDTKLSSSAALEVHKRIHTGDRPFSCKQCGSTFTTKGNLQRHEKSHTGERPYECEECHKRFSEAKTLKVHMRTHTGERPYKCEVCGMSFTQSGVLQNHMHIHSGVQGHLCDWCGKSFRQKSNLNIHVKRHLNTRDYKCDICQFSCFAKADLARHKMKHSGEKPFLCELCPKSFTRLQYLNEHMNLHLGNRPHKCKKCPATFYDLSAYHRHIHKHRVEEKEKNKSKLNEEEEQQPTTSRLIMTRNTISQSALQQLGAVINQEAERIQQQNEEHSYQTIIVSTDEAHHEACDVSIQPSTSFVSKGDDEGQPEVYHISLDPNILANDPANLIATVDFSAINLLANATTKQFTLS